MLQKGKAWLKFGLIIVLLLMASVSFASTVSGDLDGDGDVDRDDLNILNAARGETATGPDDPRDLDGDGEITGLDSRILVTLCTRPRCAVEPADTTPPQISITSPVDNSETSEASITVTGSASDETELASVTVNGVAVVISGGAFSATISLNEGANTLTAVAADAAGNTASSSIVVTRSKTVVDAVLPLVAITSPANESKTTETNIQVAGSASDDTELASVTVNGVNATISGGTFSATVALSDGANAITAVATDAAGNTASSGITVTRLAPLPPPTISNFTPTSISTGQLLTITGTSFAAHSGAQPVVSIGKQGGGTVNAPVASFNATTATITIPASAATGPVGVTVDGQSATSISALTITASSDFTLTAAPTSINVIQGKTAGLSVSVGTTNNFAQLVKLAVSGLPSGVTASFKPEQVAAGQSSLLTITVPASQAAGGHSLTISGTATVDGINLNHSATVALNVEAVTTSFLGRTVVANAEQTPLAGVTITMLGKDGNGVATQCTGTTTSDAAGNFNMTNLPDGCVGAQLIRYDGSTVTAPAGEYAGVDLIYTVVANQVTESPVLVHLPRVDDGETVNVIQNHTLDQTFRFSTIPNLSVTIYAGTTLSLKDGTQPNPFPLTAVEVPIDRLPEEMPPSDELSPFIVAFQPANAEASQPIAVTFPNLVNTPPGTNVTLTTLDPTKGTMVSYGTGTVSEDGLKIVPDPDPAHSGHRYGLVHFDWHGPTGPTPNQNDPCPGGPCAGDPVHLSSGLVIEQRTDLAMPAPGGGISIQRNYRTMSANAGPFGIGWNHNYSYFLNLSNPSPSSAVINFIVPAGNQFPMSNNGGGLFTNTNEPSLRGAVLKVNTDGTADLTFKNGSVFHFVPGGFRVGSVLQSITDLNGNTTTLVRNTSNPIEITEIVDSVGRKFELTYGSANRISQVTDPIGRTVNYTYTSFGRLETVTDPEGGVTRYSYVRPTASAETNRLETITDARGVVIARNLYGLYYGPSCNGATGVSDDDLATWTNTARLACLTDTRTVRDERVWKQVAADGGEIHFRYTLVNQSLPLSPVIQTAVTDALGHTTTYRFSTQGQPLSVIDPAGQTMVFDREPGTNQLLGKRGNAICSICGNISTGDSKQTIDENGNIIATEDVLGNVNTFTYDARFNKPASATNTLGHTGRTEYDDRGNLIEIIDAKGNTTVFSYDSRGLLLAITDAQGNKSNFNYDASSNLIKSTDAIGHITQFNYDAVGRLIETIDAQGRRSKLAYDKLNRTTSQTDDKERVTNLSYDAVGNLLSVTDARGKTVSFTYDAMSRLVKQADAVGKADLFEYDLNGNLVKFTDRRGQISVFEYDNLDRLVISNYPDGDIVKNSYDARSRLVRVEDSASGVQTFQYNALGRLISESAENGTINYQYDLLSRLNVRQIVGQPAVTYDYDVVGNLLSVSDTQASVNLGYDVLNRRTTIQRGNGVKTDHSFDALSRILSINHSNAVGSIDQQAYAYDKTGNRKSMANTLGQPYTTQSANATYDEANRLVARGEFAYTYDENGNRITKTGLQGITNYTWDSRNRLITIAEPSGTTTHFVYDAFNNLLSQQITGPTKNLETVYQLDGAGNVVQQSSSNGDVFSVLTGLGIDDHLAVTRNDGTLSYILRDAINSTVATTDKTGALQQSISYEPYGQTSSVSTSFPIQYTGRLPVSDGLYYYRARFYDPEAGRFLSEDPIGLAGGLNPYAYVGGNPVNYNDPLGLCPWCVAYLIFEIGLAVYDAYDTINTFLDPCASDFEKAFAAGAFLAGAVLPGGGYSQIDNVAQGTSKTFFRNMSRAEAKAVKDTGKLRGGNPGDTFFTDQRFRTGDRGARAQDRLSLPQRPEVQVEFRITNNPSLQRNATRVTPANGGRGGGREFMTTDPVQVEIINVQPF